MKTGDFMAVYKDGYEYEALHTLQILHYYRAQTESIIGPYETSLPVVIEDVGAVSNGFANPVFQNIHIFTHAPGFSYRLEGIESWYRTVAVHEYAHILHLSRARGLPGLLTTFFGPLFAPNIYSPGWIIEGITVFSESQNTRYEGRLNDGFFDAYIGARASAGSMPSLIEATNTPLSFPLGTYYLYGGEFFDFLGRRYGTERFASFFGHYGSYFWAPLSAVLPFTGLDVAARRAFGRPWPGLFDEWKRYEEHRYQSWQPAGRRITERGWYMYSLAASNDRLYYVRYEPVKLDAFRQLSLTRIIEFDRLKGTERTIAHLNRIITTPLRVHKGKLYYTTPQFASGYANVYYRGRGITANLHERDLITGEDRILLTDAIRGFCVLPDGSIFYSRDRARGFGSEIRLYDSGANELLFESELLVGELAVSGGRTVVTARHDFENWDIYRFDREARTLEPLVATPWIEGSIGLHGDTLYFTANHEKTYSIYMCDLENGGLYRLTRDGYADFGVAVDNVLYFIGITGDGFDLYAADFAPVEYVLPCAVPAARPDLDARPLAVVEGGYCDVAGTLVPALRMPCLIPTNSDLSEWAYGLLFLGGDATDENVYGGFIAQRTAEQGMAFNFLWQSQFFAPAGLSLLYDYGNALEYTVAYPAYWSLEYGVSSLSLFVDGRVFDRAARKEFAPGLYVALQYPSTTFGACFSFPYERPAWGSQISRSAQRMRISARQVILGGEGRFFSDAYVDRDDPETPSFSLRGYEPIATARALSVTAEYGHRLLGVRRGLWNPNVYLEDLFWTVFADFAWTDAGAAYYSAGVEMRLEVKAGFGFVQLVPKLGLALTKSGAVKVYLALSPELPI